MQPNPRDQDALRRGCACQIHGYPHLGAIRPTVVWGLWRGQGCLDGWGLGTFGVGRRGPGILEGAQKRVGSSPAVCQLDATSLTVLGKQAQGSQGMWRISWADGSCWRLVVTSTARCHRPRCPCHQLCLAHSHRDSGWDEAVSTAPSSRCDPHSPHLGSRFRGGVGLPLALQWAPSSGNMGLCVQRQGYGIMDPAPGTRDHSPVPGTQHPAPGLHISSGGSTPELPTPCSSSQPWYQEQKFSKS